MLGRGAASSTGGQISQTRGVVAAGRGARRARRDRPARARPGRRPGRSAAAAAARRLRRAARRATARASSRSGSRQLAGETTKPLDPDARHERQVGERSQRQRPGAVLAVKAGARPAGERSRAAPSSSAPGSAATAPRPAPRTVSVGSLEVGRADQHEIGRRDRLARCPRRDPSLRPVVGVLAAGVRSRAPRPGRQRQDCGRTGGAVQRSASASDGAYATSRRSWSGLRGHLDGFSSASASSSGAPSAAAKRPQVAPAGACRPSSQPTPCARGVRNSSQVRGGGSGGRMLSSVARVERDLDPLRGRARRRSRRPAGAPARAAAAVLVGGDGRPVGVGAVEGRRRVDAVGAQRQRLADPARRRRTASVGGGDRLGRARGPGSARRPAASAPLAGERAAAPARRALDDPPVQRQRRRRLVDQGRDQ